MKTLKVGFVSLVKITSLETHSTGMLSLNEGWPKDVSQYSLVYKKASSHSISEIIQCIHSNIFFIDIVNEFYVIRVKCIGNLAEEFLEYLIKTGSKKETNSWFCKLKNINCVIAMSEIELAKKQIFDTMMRKSSRKKNVERNILMADNNLSNGISAINFQICTRSEYELKEEGCMAHFEVNATVLELVIHKVKKNKKVFWNLDTICHFGSSGDLFLINIYDEKTDNEIIFSFQTRNSLLLCKLLVVYCQEEKIKSLKVLSNNLMNKEDDKMRIKQNRIFGPLSDYKSKTDDINIDSSQGSDSLVTTNEALNIPKNQSNQQTIYCQKKK